MAARERTVTRTLFWLLLALYLISASLRVDSGDGETMYRVAYSLVTGQGLAIPVNPEELVDGRSGYGQLGRNGFYYSKYGLGWSLAVVPLCALGRVLASLSSGVTEGFATRAAVMLFNPLVTAATAVLLFRLARRLYPVRAAVTLALLYGLGTIAWYYAKSAFSEPLVTLLLLGAIVALERDCLVEGGAALGGMILTRQTSFLLVVPVVAWVVVREWRRGLRHLLRSAITLLAPLALGQLIALIYNFCRFGDWLDFGYSRVTWSTPLLQGLYNQLLSPGKGLFVFMPVLLLGVLGWPALLRARRDWAWLSLALTVCYLVPHALYRDWTGGGGWGPRLLLPIVPFVLLPAGTVVRRWQARRLGRVALMLVVTLSLLVQVLGVSANWARHLQRVRGASEMKAEYIRRVHEHWPESPIPGQMRALVEVLAMVRDPDARAGLGALVGPHVELPLRDWQSESVGLLSFNVPDLWFVYLWFLGVPPGWLAGVVLILAGVAVGAALRLRRALGED